MPKLRRQHATANLLFAVLRHLLLGYLIYQDEVIPVSVQFGESKAMRAKRIVIKLYLRNLCQLHFIYHVSVC